jgi:DNA-binding NarL/FixJ family response regulator
MTGAAWRTVVVASGEGRQREIKALLGEACAVVLETGDLTRAKGAAPDLIVVDGAWLEAQASLEPLQGCAVLLMDATPAGLETLRRAQPHAWGALEGGVDADAVQAAAQAVARGMVVLEPRLIPNNPSPEHVPEALTPREFEVLGLLFEGFENKRIAAELRISPSTVKYHLEGVYAKLGVRSKAQAVRRALELGLVSV